MGCVVMLHDGLYEQIINKELETELGLTDKLSATAPIDSAEASKVLAKYIAEVVEKGLDKTNEYCMETQKAHLG